MDNSLNSKIRVAHIITRMDRGGAPDIVRILFDKIDPNWFDLTLIYGNTIFPSNKTQEFLKNLNEKAVLVPSLARKVNLFFDFMAFLDLVVILQKGRFDIVHTHTAKAGALGRIAAKLVGVRSVIYSPHGHDFYGYFNKIGSFLVKWAEKICALFCEKIHVLTELEKNDFIKFGICLETKLEVIYSGVELEVYRRKKSLGISWQNLLEEKKEEDMWVGMIGRLEPIKGPMYLIEAAALIVAKKPAVRFLVAGEGDLRISLEARVAELGLTKNFKFLGWREDIEEILPILDILVLPSLNEGVGRSALEAQAAGVPVVASRVGGVPEVVKDKETGILVEAKDINGLAQAVLSLLEEEHKRHSMSEAAKKWVDEKFSDHAMVDRFMELYRKLHYRA